MAVSTSTNEYTVTREWLVVKVSTHLKVREDREDTFCHHTRFAVVLLNLLWRELPEGSMYSTLTGCLADSKVASMADI